MKSFLIDLARRQIGLLHAEIKFLASHQKSRPDDVRKSHQKLIKIVRQSRLALLQLSTCIESLGDDPEQCPEVQFLIGLIHEATLHSSELYQLVFTDAKRCSLQAFEKSVLETIQHGKGPPYMRTISKQEILNQGDEVNRLYQLLVEGKTSYLRVDAATLKTAAARNDLFSSRQCAQLSKQSIELEKWMLEETERVASSLESSETLDHGALLQKLGGENRPTVSLATSDGWSCSKCTYYNEQSSVVDCQTCGSPQYEDFVTVAKREPKRKPPPENKEQLDIEKHRASQNQPEQHCASIELHIENNAVPSLIGPRGKHVHALIQQTGVTNIYAHQKRLDEFNYCPIEITGSTAAIEKAKAIINEKFSSQLIESRIVWIANIDVPRFIGLRGRDAQALKKETGIKFVTADQNNSVDGYCPIRIKGCRSAVEIAADLVIQRFFGSVDCPLLPCRERDVLQLQPAVKGSKLPVQEQPKITPLDSSISKKCMAEDASNNPTTCQNAVTELGIVSDPVKKGSCLLDREQSCRSDTKLLPSSAHRSEKVPLSLLAVLQKHKDALKSSATVSSFHQWLQSVDIENLDDFRAALQDDEVF